MSDTEKMMRAPVPARPILYTDTIYGEQCRRDDMWAVTTEELNQLAASQQAPCNYPLCQSEAEQQRLGREIVADMIGEPAFDAWWDADRLTQTNPYRQDSPVYWAWEGWQAAMSQPAQEPHPSEVEMGKRGLDSLKAAMQPAQGERQPATVKRCGGCWELSENCACA